MTAAHRENSHATPMTTTLKHDRPAVKSEPRSPVGDSQHRRKIRKVSPRSVGGSTHSSTSSGGEEDGDDGDLDADAFIAARNNTTRKSPLPAAHEIKHLRHEAATLERQFRQLCTKWKTHLPDRLVLLQACDAAKQKTITMQVERINSELKQQLLQQQLFFSSLQSNLSESPLWQSNSTCQAIFHDVHHELRLPKGDDATRRDMLQARFERAQRDASATIERYTREHVHTTTPAIPYSHTAASGTEEFTYMSNVFICKIPNAKLRDVFHATVDHYTNLPVQLERHLGMKTSAAPICSLGDTQHYSQLEYTSGDFAGVLSNVTFQAEMVNDDLALLEVDFVDEDTLHPNNKSVNSLRKDGLSILMLTPVFDKTTNQNCILLRRLLVHRYNLLPNSSRLHNEVNSMVSYLNGDLTMAMLPRKVFPLGQANCIDSNAGRVPRGNVASLAAHRRAAAVRRSEIAALDVVMPSSDQPPPSLSAVDASLVCRTCGCLIFSNTSNECDTCRTNKTQTSNSANNPNNANSKTTPVLRHPFLSLGKNTNASNLGRPNASGGPPMSSTTNGAQDAAARTHGVPVRAKTPPLGSNGDSERQQAQHVGGGNSTAAPNGKPDATATKINPPGSSVGSSTCIAAWATTASDHKPSLAASALASGRTSASGASSNGVKRPRPAAQLKKSDDVIDLISSDEESENAQRRAAKRAKENARLQGSVARLALRQIDPPLPPSDAAAVGREQIEVIDQPRPRELFQARSFDTAEFNPSDFPTQQEMLQAMRQRHTAPGSRPAPLLLTPARSNRGPASNGTASALTTPRSVLSTAPTVADAAVPTTPVGVYSIFLRTAKPTVPSPGSNPSVSVPSTPPPPASAPASRTSTPPPPDSPSPPLPTPPLAVSADTSASNNAAASLDSKSPPAVSGTTNRAPPPQPIVLGDSEDEGDIEVVEDNGGPALFQSRQFDSVVFNGREFLTVNDGLNLARRSGPGTTLPLTPEPKGSEAADPSTYDTSAGEGNQAEGPSLPTTPTTSGPNLLQARRKPPTANTKTVSAVPADSPLIKKENSTVVRIIKPMLGHCSTDFLQFMRECVDDDDDQDDYEELARAKLHEVVDLTNMSDESGDDDEEDEDGEDRYFEIIEVKTSSSAAPEINAPSILTNPVETKPLVLGAVAGAPVVKRTRAPRPKETCMLCEDRAWIKVLVNCPDCKKYYHKKCAREYGDEVKCWNCDLNGMIDDSDLTEEHKSEVVTMFGALRQSLSDSDTGEEGDNELEDKADIPDESEENPFTLPVLDGKATRSMRRWKEFLDVATAPIEKSFHEATSVITQELQDEQRKNKYSKGFASKDEVERAMSEVLDHYAELQDKEERLMREERSRIPAADATAVEGASIEADQEGSRSEQLDPTEEEARLLPASTPAFPTTATAR